MVQALMEDGYDQAFVHFVDVDELEARKILLADNRYPQLARMDDGLLVSLLQSLPDLEGTGYDDKALQELLDRRDQDRATDDHLITCPNCGHRFSLKAGEDHHEEVTG
jgi:hypothetical protein